MKIFAGPSIFLSLHLKGRGIENGKIYHSIKIPGVSGTSRAGRQNSVLMKKTRLSHKVPPVTRAVQQYSQTVQKVLGQLGDESSKTQLQEGPLFAQHQTKCYYKISLKQGVGGRGLKKEIKEEGVGGL